MKNLLLATLLFTPAILGAAPFEGKISLKMTSGRNQPQDITYSIKGDKVRLDLPGKQGMGGMIMDLTKREATVVIDQQKMYMTMAMPETPPEAAAKQKSDVQLERTGETEKILGYTAAKWIATSGGNKTELWLAEGLGRFVSPNQEGPMMGGRRGGGGGEQPWEKALGGKDLFPLRVVGKDFRMEATAIDKATLPDTLFVPPADYRQFDMSAMMKGMMPGAR